MLHRHFNRSNRMLNRHRSDIRAIQRFKRRRRASTFSAMLESVLSLWELRWPDLLP